MITCVLVLVLSFVNFQDGIEGLVVTVAHFGTGDLVGQPVGKLFHLHAHPLRGFEKEVVYPFAGSVSTRRRHHPVRVADGLVRHQLILALENSNI